MDNKKIGEILLQLRKNAGETTSEVAAAIGVSQSTISMYENGNRVPRDNLKVLLARHFGVSVSDIFFAERAHKK